MTLEFLFITVSVVASNLQLTNFVSSLVLTECILLPPPWLRDTEMLESKELWLNACHERMSNDCSLLARKL